MAYDYNSLVLVQNSNAQGLSKLWTYTSSTDALATIEASGYFTFSTSTKPATNDLTPLIAAGDSIWVYGSNGNAQLSVVSLAPIVTSASLLAGNGFLNTSVTVTLANFIAMYSAPIALVAAPGANKMLILQQAQVLQTYGSAALAAGGVSAVQYGSTTHGGGTIASTTLSAATYQQTASSVYTYNPGVVVLPFSSCVNAGLYLSCLTADFTTGTGSTFVIDVWYSIVATA